MPFGGLMLVISFSFTVEPCMVPSASKFNLVAEFKLKMFRSLRMKVVMHWHREMDPSATVLRET